MSLPTIHDKARTGAERAGALPRRGTRLPKAWPDRTAVVRAHDEVRAVLGTLRGNGTAPVPAGEAGR